MGAQKYVTSPFFLMSPTYFKEKTQIQKSLMWNNPDWWDFKLHLKTLNTEIRQEVVVMQYLKETVNQ